jgi:hypothetical protein
MVTTTGGGVPDSGVKIGIAVCVGAAGGAAIASSAGAMVEP